MREATGNALLMVVMTTVIAVIMIFFVGSISYSKAYRIKNYIIKQIEEKRTWNSELEKKVDGDLKKAGYYVSDGRRNCDNYLPTNKSTCTYVSDSATMDYCVFKCNTGRYDYYSVVAFSKFSFPVIGRMVEFKVSGETVTFNDFN